MIVLATTGRIVGGWEFVWAAYGVTWLFLVGYFVSLWLRSRNAEEGS